MEAFGRSLAVMLSAIGLVILLLFYKTAAVRWQKTETVRSLCKAYAEKVMRNNEIHGSDWKQFTEQLDRLGDYRTELAVYERKRYERENGRVYLFTESVIEDENLKLMEGSYVRLIVTEESSSRLGTMLYGEGSPVIFGGRIA